MAFHVLDLLEKAAATDHGLVFYGKEGEEVVQMSYGELLRVVKSNAARLLHHKIANPNRPILIHLDNQRQYVEWYWSVLAAGAIPCISTPLPTDPVAAERHLKHIDVLLGHPKVLTCERLRGELGVVGGLDVVALQELADGEDPFAHQTASVGDVVDGKTGDDEKNGSVIRILENELVDEGLAEGDDIITTKPSSELISLNKAIEQCKTSDPADALSISELSLHSSDLSSIDDGSHLPETPHLTFGYAKYPDQPAALMLTSGSTGNAKAVVLEHNQILASIQGKTKALGNGHEDVYFNWIGFDHVACLLESHMEALLYASNQVHMLATTLLMDPLKFLAVIEEQKVTTTFAPNFFLAMVAREYQSAGKNLRVDLGSLRHIVSGGEANVTALAVEITDMVKKLGGPDSVVRSAFGMTETCAACTYNLNCPAYELERKSQFCAIGTPFEELKQRITDDVGAVLPAGEFGNLEVSGPMVFKRYYNNEVATKDSFTSDGWFKTGDKGYADSNGVLFLSGRSKDSLIINGVKYFSHELEGAIEEAHISGITPSYVAVFSVFPSSSIASEEVVVVFLPTPSMMTSEEDFAQTISDIARTSTLYCSKRPIDIVPLPLVCLPKSALGKLSRPKLKTAYEAGAFDEFRKQAKDRLTAYNDSIRVAPTTETQIKIAELFASEYGVAVKDVGIHDSLADMGVDSVGVIRFKKLLEDTLALETQIPMISILRNPSVEGIAHELWKLEEKVTAAYEPVVELQPAPSKGARLPIIFVHPGLGEILVFLNIAKYFKDRAVYAIRAPGFNAGEEMFATLDEMTDTYIAAILRVQPVGPYILCGYSFGGMIAFEIAKKLTSRSHTVGFLAIFNLPPHIKTRMQELDWTETILTLASFLSFIPEPLAVSSSPALHASPLSEDEILDWVLARSPPARLAELDMDREKLRHWAHLSVNLHSLAKYYEPEGRVANMDVFYARPLLSVGIESKKAWLEESLMKWGDFAGDVAYHDCVGNHWTMLDGEHCWGLQKAMKEAMAKRGVL